MSFFLKQAYLLAITALFSIIFTWGFKNICVDTFEQSYNDAALLQTSELDGWKVNEEMSFVERERYRKWVVDCHKASYVPVCVNAEDDYLTSEPAVVIPTAKEIDNPFENGMVDNYERDASSSSSPKTTGRQRTSTVDSYNSFRSRNGLLQRGATFRRVTDMFYTPNGDRNSQFILEESESNDLNGSPALFPRQIIDSSSQSESELNDESRDKLL